MTYVFGAAAGAGLAAVWMLAAASVCRLLICEGGEGA